MYKGVLWIMNVILFCFSDKKFLSIHGVTDEETMFNWKINLK